MIDKIYLSSVAIEKNRWDPERKPTIEASCMIQRALEDGFDGIELWENHYLMAGNDEKRRLEKFGSIAVFNTYAKFEHGMTDELRRVADAVFALNAGGVKFNLGKTDGNLNNSYSQKDISEMLNTLMAFADLLPKGTRLLSECHNGSAMQKAEDAHAIFNQLDNRFGAIVHLPSDSFELRKKIAYYGDKICHIHTQYRANPFAPWPDEPFEPLIKVAEKMKFNLDMLRACNYIGSASIEFCAGSADPESCYEGALADLRYLRSLAELVMRR